VISTANTSIDSRISWKCRGKNFDDNAIKKTSSANNVDWSWRSLSNVELSKRSSVKNIDRRWRSESNVDRNERKSAKNVGRRWRSVSNVDRNDRKSAKNVDRRWRSESNVEWSKRSSVSDAEWIKMRGASSVEKNSRNGETKIGEEQFLESLQPLKNFKSNYVKKISD
jgi:hypothetical protein